MAGPNRALGVSGRVYRALLMAYPREFRREYGSQMEQTFLRDLCREESRGGGKSGFVRLWLRTIADLGTTACAERIGALGRSGGEGLG